MVIIRNVYRHYTNVKSLCSALEADIILYINCISVRKKEEGMKERI